MTRISQPDTTEAGVSARFSVVPDSAPKAYVLVPLASSDGTEGTDAPTSLRFTTGNWNLPQTARVTGVDDCAPDGDVGYQMRIGPTTSSDPAYDGIAPDGLGVVNRNNDAPGGHPTLHVCNYTLVSKVRAGRFDYDYSFRVDLTNTGGAVGGATATVTSANANTQVIDGQVLFGPIGAGETALSNDTFTIRQNRQYPFDLAALRWQVDPQP